MGNAKLTATQRGRAEQLLEDVKKGRINKPQDIGLIDSWEPIGSREMVENEGYSRTSLGKTKIDPRKIAGVDIGNVPRNIPDHNNIYRLVCSNLKSILNGLIDGTLEIDDPTEIPRYVEYEDEYYVEGAGIHRSIACKAIRLDTKLTAEVWRIS